MSLENDSQLNSIGQDLQGRAFVSIALDVEKMQGRKFGVAALAKDGRELQTTGTGAGGGVRSGIRVEQFDFGVPLAEIAEFRIGTRPIRTNEWRNVVLPGK